MLWFIYAYWLVMFTLTGYFYLAHYKRAGRVQFSPKISQLAWLSSIFFLITAFLLYSTSRPNYLSDTERLKIVWATIFYGSNAVWVYILGFMRFKVMEAGILIQGILLKWSDIDSYLWDTYHKRLTLNLKKRNPWYMGKKTLRIRLSLENGFQAEAHMKEHLTKATGPWE